jgi:hypothetical protein
MLHVNRKAIVGAIIGLSMWTGGCSTSQKASPHMGFGKVEVQAQLKREDLVVLDPVEGQSTNTTILFGLLNIVDGNKVEFLGIKFFEDKYTFLEDEDSLWVRPENRAYYKALEKQADADAILNKSWDRSISGIPLLWETRSATVRGKAVKLKSDK